MRDRLIHVTTIALLFLGTFLFQVPAFAVIMDNAYQPLLDSAAVYFDVDEDSLRVYVERLELHEIPESDEQALAYLHKYRAELSYIDLKFSESIENTDRAMVYFDDVDNRNELGWLLNNKGRCYYNIGDYESATSFHLLALEQYETINDQPGIAETYNNLGRVTYEAGNFETSKVYFESALGILNELGLEYEIYKLYNNVGIILMDEGELPQALTYFWRAARGYEALGDSFRLSVVKGNLAVNYEEMGERDSALILVREAYALSIKMDNESRIIPGLINMGSFQRLLMEYDSAYQSFATALELSKKHNLKYYESLVYDEFSDLYTDMEQYEAALENHMKGDSLHDIMAGEQQRARINKMILAYSQEARDREMAVLKDRQKLQATVNYALAVGISVSIILIFILFAGTRKIKGQQRMLTEQNRALERVNERLSASEQSLMESIEDRNKLFSIVAHDLRNPVAAISGFTDLLDNNFDKLNDGSKRDYIEQIKLGSVKTLTLLNNLLLWARSQMNSIEVKAELTPLHELVNETLDLLIFTADNKGIKVINEVDPNLQITIDREMIKVVLRNLVTNGIKFSEKGTTIVVSSTESADNHCLVVKDQGIGIKQEVLDSLFKEDRLLTTQGTDNETGSGLGLLISRDFTERNGAIMKVESEVGKGSTFTICFNKNNTHLLK